MLTTERKVYVAVLGLGLAALGVDHLFSGSGAGAPAAAAAAVAQSDAPPTPAARTSSKAQATPTIRTVAFRIERMATENGPPAPGTVDAFLPAAPFRAAMPDPKSEATPEKLAPTAGPDKLVEQFRLTTVVKGKSGGAPARALINGRMYSIGDTVGEFTITAIDDDGVVLTLDEKSWTLTVPRPDNAR